MSGKKYRVLHHDGWTCECADFKFRGKACKHVMATQFWLKVRDGIKPDDMVKLETIMDDKSCSFCNSFSIVKNGSRKNKNCDKQRFFCKDCKKSFILDMAKKTKGNEKIITLVLDLYFKGVSLRKIEDHLKQFYQINVRYVTIYRWIRKFSKIMNDYVSKFQPKVSEAWHVDELKEGGSSWHRCYSI